MAIKSVKGASVLIGSLLGANLPITAISNANPAIASLSATTGLASNDTVTITSSWDRLVDRVTQVTLTGSDITLLGVDTTDLNRYPASGGDVNSYVREVTEWTTIGQIREWTSAGGEMEFEDITTIADYIRKQIPTQRSAITFDMGLFWDPKLGWWDTIVTLSESLTQYPFKIVLAGATDTIMGNGYISLGKVPTITGTLLTTRLGFAIASEITVL
jgi:hypothetical protein